MLVCITGVHMEVYLMITTMDQLLNLEAKVHAILDMRACEHHVFDLDKPSKHNKIVNKEKRD